MNNFQFRAFSKSQNKFLTIGFSVIGEVTVFDMLNDHCLRIKDLDDIIVTQNTGLKDCDGKEIYQGDLVKTEKANSYLSGTYEVIWDAKKGRWAYKGNSYQVGKSGNLKCWVVGNIFKNNND